MLGLAGLKGIAVALAVGMAIGGAGGWRVAKAFGDARWFKAQAAAQEAAVKTLEARIRVVNAAARAEQARAAAAENHVQAMKEKADALEARITAGQCFVGDDAERVRELWRAPTAGGKTRPAAGPRRIEDLLEPDRGRPAGGRPR